MTKEELRYKLKVGRKLRHKILMLITLGTNTRHSTVVLAKIMEAANTMKYIVTSSENCTDKVGTAIVIVTATTYTDKATNLPAGKKGNGCLDIVNGLPRSNLTF